MKKKASNPTPAKNTAGPQMGKTGGQAATHDPNYQTLAGIGPDCFGADKKGGAGAGGGGGGGAGGAPPKPPTKGGMVGMLEQWKGRE